MTGVEIATLALSAVGTVMSVANAQSQAKFARAAAERDRIAAEETARAAKLKAAQDEVLRLEDLRNTRSTQIAQAAALHFDPHQSRSFLAIQKNTDRIARRDIENIKLNALLTERRVLLSADASQVAARGSQVSANLRSAAAVFNFGGKILKTGRAGGWFNSSSDADIGDTTLDSGHSDPQEFN